MTSKVANQLKTLIEEYGTALCDDPKRCRALLLDYCGDYKKEVNIMCIALENNVPQELLSSKNTPYEIQRSRLTKKLTDEYAMAEEAALWCLEVWAFALGIKDALPQVPGVSASKQDDDAKEEKQLETPAIAEPAFHKYDSRLTNLNADYYIDYENGYIPLGDLPIGARVVDPTWEWEFRTGNDYTCKAGDETKPVTWIVVAHDHYVGLEPHVTLLSEKLIGKHAFDNSTSRGGDWGSNHWGESGSGDATSGLRPWINSSGIHLGEGFYRAFSEGFKQAVLTTNVPNREWKRRFFSHGNTYNGNTYNTNDHVLLPSKTELGNSYHKRAYPVSTPYPYFSGADNVKRAARLRGKAWWYWTRSPASDVGGVRCVTDAGELFNGASVNHDGGGVRPALNLKSGILVSEIRN